MTNKEQIIIDGVDVSTCKGLKYEPDGIKKPICLGGGIKGIYRSCLCEKNQNCHFKQLARKTQELYFARNEVHSKAEYIREQRDIIDKLKQECEELNKKLRELELKNTILQNRNQQLDSSITKAACYRKALEEIEEVTKINCEEICGRKFEDCNDIHCFSAEILNIIN